jgi:hypothetical protein
MQHTPLTAPIHWVFSYISIYIIGVPACGLNSDPACDALTVTLRVDSHYTLATPY